MRIAAFAIVAILISLAIIQWMYFSRRDKTVIKRHIKRWWWVPLLVFSLLFMLAAINSQFTLKLF